MPVHPPRLLGRRGLWAGGCGVEVADQQLLLELRGPRDRLAGAVEHEGVAVEDELVLAADQSAEGDADAVLAGALGEQALALQPLPGVVGRGGDVDDQLGPGPGLLGWLGGRAPRGPRRPSRRRAWPPTSMTAPAGPAVK